MVVQNIVFERSFTIFIIGALLCSGKQKSAGLQAEKEVNAFCATGIGSPKPQRRDLEMGLFNFSTAARYT